MDKRFILTGLIVAIVLIGGLAIVSIDRSNEGGGSIDLAGHWYVVGGDAYIDNTLHSLDSYNRSGMLSVVDLYIDEARDNVFYGMYMDQDIKGAYFDDGRFGFTYTSEVDGITYTNSFEGHLHGGLIYSSTCFLSGALGKEMYIASSFVYSRDLGSVVGKGDIPDMKGEWIIGDAYAYVEGKEFTLVGDDFVVDGQSGGVFFGTIELHDDGTVVKEGFIGTVRGITEHGQYVGTITIEGTGEMWFFTLENGHIRIYGAKPAASIEDPRPVSHFRSYTRSGSIVEHDYPQLVDEIFVTESKGTAVSVKSGNGKIVESYNETVLHIKAQSGPTLSGSLAIDGAVYEGTGFIDCAGHFFLCSILETSTERIVIILIGEYYDGVLYITSAVGPQGSKIVLFNKCDSFDLGSEQTKVDEQSLLGSWRLSTFSAANGVLFDYFNGEVPEMPLYITSIENGIVKGIYGKLEFVGTYSKDRAAGYIWFVLPFHGGELNVEMSVSHKGYIVASLTYTSTDLPIRSGFSTCIYTRDVAFVPTPLGGIDVFGEWELSSAQAWNGGKESDVTVDGSKLFLSRIPTDGGFIMNDRFLEGMIVIGDGDQIINLEGYMIYVMGGFWEAYFVDEIGSDYYVYPTEDSIVMLCSSVHDGSIGAKGLGSLQLIFVRNGAEAPSIPAEPYLVNHTFTTDSFSLTILDQSSTFIMGTVRFRGNTFDFMGPLLGEKPFIISEIVMTNGTDIQRGYIRFEFSSSEFIEQIHFETVWVDGSESHAVHVVARW